MGLQSKHFFMLMLTLIGILVALRWCSNLTGYKPPAHKAIHGVFDHSGGGTDHFRNVSQPVDDGDVLTVAIFRQTCGAKKCTKCTWLGKDCFASCPRCRVIDDMIKSDAVFFTIHSMWIDCPFDLPRRTSYHQKWIMVSRESPRIQIKSKYWNQFNATASYMSISDVVYPYGKLKIREQPPLVTYKDRDWNTKKNVAWLVSNCANDWGRRTYADELAKYIDITIFGRCGTQTCKRDDTSCMASLFRSYRFYLAFENSLCKDYVTEKLFRTLNSSMIPIVYGLANYSSILPQKSFIDVRDFNSPRQLANYLKTLAANKTLFDAYFKWKEQYEVTLTSADYNTHYLKLACSTCEYLHRTRYDAPKTVDLATFNSRDIQCVPKETFLPSVGIPVASNEG